MVLVYKVSVGNDSASVEDAYHLSPSALFPTGNITAVCPWTLQSDLPVVHGTAMTVSGNDLLVATKVCTMLFLV